MFWDKGYTPSQNIESLLQKENVTVEEFLDDEDILQECKTQKRNLIQYLTRPDVIKRLIELTITEPPEDVPINQRFKHANMACEILTFGLPSLDEKLVEDEEILKTLYSYLENEPPLNPLLSSFFNKTFGMLISKKPETDWFLYQKMCLQVLEFIKTRGNFLDLIFRHFATPVIMDLLLQIIKDVQGGALKKDLYEWLTEQKLVERLIRMLGQPEESEKHKNIADFLCDLIRHGRSIRQTDQQDNNSFEPIFIGCNPLLQSVESNEAVSQLFEVILLPHVTESTITSVVQVVLTLADESIVDEPASDLALQLIRDKEKENYEKVVATIIEVVEPKLDSLLNILLNPPEKNYITTGINLSPPFGLTRLQICRLFTVLLRTGNSNLIDAICKTEILNTLLKLFKEYCWNNFLHSEVEKCLEYVFSNNNNDNNSANNKNFNHINQLQIQQQNAEQQLSENIDNEISNGDKDDKFNKNPSALQIYAIVNCRVISKLIECWMLNKEMQTPEKGRRLGYMGHLIKIFDTITTAILESEQLGALIESNLLEDELKNWQLITDKEEGEFVQDINTQRRMLANCSAPMSADSADYNINLANQFENDKFSSDFFDNLTLPDSIDDDQVPSCESVLEKLCEFFEGGSILSGLSSGGNANIALSLQNHLKPWDCMDNDMDNDIGLFRLPKDSDNTIDENAFTININPWSTDPFSGNAANDNANDCDSSGWTKNHAEYFADFDSHFNDFDLGLSSGGNFNNIGGNNTEQNEISGNNMTDSQQATGLETNTNLSSHLRNSGIVKSDDNANIEKVFKDKSSVFNDDFELNTKTNAEKIITNIINEDEDNSDRGGGDGGGKMQVDDDDIIVNKSQTVDEHNSFNKVQMEVFNNSIDTDIENLKSASNGPIKTEELETNSTEVTKNSDSINIVTSKTVDNIEIDNNTISSTGKDTSSNSNEISDANTDDGGCDDAVSASIADESS